MPFTREIDVAQQARLEQLAALLTGCRDGYMRIVEDYRWEPASGSLAATDVAELASTGGGHMLIHHAVSTYLELAGHHCGGLAGLYVAGEVFASPGQLVRSILENSARAVWIIGYDLTTGTPSERLARTCIDTDLSYEEERKAIKKLAGKTSAEYVASTTVYERFRALIKTRFPGDFDFSRATVIHGQKKATPSDCVVAYFTLLEARGGSGISATVTEGIYTRLSNETHPTLYTLRNRRRPFDLDKAHVGSRLILDPTEIERLTKLAVAAVYSALSWTHNYFGWAFDPDDRLADLIESTLPDLFLPPPH